MRRPLKSSESVPLDALPVDAEHPRGRMLIIEGAAEARRALLAELRPGGWQVFAAGDLKTAVDLAIAHQPDVILSALELPGVQGFHFVRALRGAVDHDIRIIGMTATIDARATAAEHAGFDRVLVKPLDLARVAEALT